MTGAKWFQKMEENPFFWALLSIQQQRLFRAHTGNVGLKMLHASEWPCWRRPSGALGRVLADSVPRLLFNQEALLQISLYLGICDTQYIGIYCSVLKETAVTRTFLKTLLGSGS